MAEFVYNTTGYYAPQHGRDITWNDLDLALEWPIHEISLLPVKDSVGKIFKDAEFFLNDM